MKEGNLSHQEESIIEDEDIELSVEDKLKELDINVLNPSNGVTVLHRAMLTSNGTAGLGDAKLLLSLYNVYERNGAVVCVEPTDDKVSSAKRFDMGKDRLLFSELKSVLLGY